MDDDGPPTDEPTNVFEAVWEESAPAWAMEASAEPEEPRYEPAPLAQPQWPLPRPLVDPSARPIAEPAVPGWDSADTAFIVSPWEAAPAARSWWGLDKMTWVLGLTALFITGLVTGGSAALVLFALSLD